MPPLATSTRVVLAHFAGSLAPVSAAYSPKATSTHSTLTWPALSCPFLLLILTPTTSCSPQSRHKGLMTILLASDQCATSFTRPIAPLLAIMPCFLLSFICTSFRKLLSPATFILQPWATNWPSSEIHSPVRTLTDVPCIFLVTFLKFQVPQEVISIFYRQTGKIDAL